MLDHLLREAETFKHDHGVYPDVVYLNPCHCAELESEHPWIFANDLPLRLGFEIKVFPASVQPQPTVAYHGDLEDHDGEAEQPWHCELTGVRKSA